MNILVKLLLNSLAVLIAGYILPGVRIDGYLTALVVAVVLGVVNTVLKPILLIITLPINILTLGLFTFILNAALILLVSSLIPGFFVAGFWWALLFSLVLSLLNSFLQTL